MRKASEVEELARRVALVHKTLVFVIVIKSLVMMMLVRMTMTTMNRRGLNLWIEVASAEVVQPRKMRKGEPGILMIIVSIRLDRECDGGTSAS